MTDGRAVFKGRFNDFVAVGDEAEEGKADPKKKEVDDENLGLKLVDYN